ncbi:PREDICTED: F-box/kelch-repeat protein At4g19870-like [Camelina sativa]|uniref:F-box/kelch-repeat protein At4g19870-like n=1 Tax=Camelina sativa TaxID=90675 RepID=A0ABM0V1L2_CAMSA|nr:PREDICTED: F-box/kelch-repeat protein At4g19870-like [Camelina sativa]
MNIQVEPSEKRKRRKKTKNLSPSSSPPSSSPSLFSLPDEIVVNCLARISRSYYPTLSLVSKSFRSILSSTELYAARSQLGSTEKCLYVCASDYRCHYTEWFRLWINPNRTLPDSMTKKRRKKKKKKTVGVSFVSIPSPYIQSLPPSIVVGSEIYVVGGQWSPSSAVRVLDCRSNTWRDAPSMIVPRMFARTCVYDGKIYVMGGQVLENESWVEVFDTKTQTWACLPDPGTEVRKSYIYRITEIDGKIYFDNRDNTMYAYDTKQGKWECGKGVIATFPMSKCVIENISYSYGLQLQGNNGCWWYDIKSDEWKEVKGLESLKDKYKRSRGNAKVVSFGGNLLLLWEECTNSNPNYRKKIWCAEIGLEKRDGGEVWGIVEWVDVVHSVPISCKLFRCLVVSV